MTVSTDDCKISPVEHFPKVLLWHEPILWMQKPSCGGTKNPPVEVTQVTTKNPPVETTQVTIKALLGGNNNPPVEVTTKSPPVEVTQVMTKALLWRQLSYRQGSPPEETYVLKPPVEVAIPLSDTVLKVLGNETKRQHEEGEAIYPDLARRWDYLLQNGLDPTIRADLMKKYPPIANCKLVAVPLLNEEIKAAVTDSVLKRDAALAAGQSQVGACLAALGKALNYLIQDKEE
ncbi:unnamed protein product [Callosobruchus maculatus]|uniref:Uncharacterized protein n=1 Tax=Callosobruchus maculatus TaxID=64391 RepID=A0A653CY67_CALMS|nr:unnamed protein product [Callosobruchus maculatus]